MLRKQHKPSKSRSRRQSLGRQRRSTAPSLKGMPTSDSTAPELRHDTLYHLDHDSTQLLPTTAPSATPITAVLPITIKTNHLFPVDTETSSSVRIESNRNESWYVRSTASDNNTRPYSASSSDSSSSSSSSSSALVSYSNLSLLNISSKM